MRAVDADYLRKKFSKLSTEEISDQERALLFEVFYIVNTAPTVHPKPPKIVWHKTTKEKE